jgi:hypothetical protein
LVRAWLAILDARKPHLFLVEKFHEDNLARLRIACWPFIGKAVPVVFALRFDAGGVVIFGPSIRILRPSEKHHSPSMASA